MTRNKTLSRLSALNLTRRISLCAVICVMSIAMFSQTVTAPNRITQQVTAGAIVKMSGSIHPLTRQATDVGPVDSDMAMSSLTLNIGLSTTEQADLNALLAAQQNPKSPQYHQWLTQEEYGARFGLTEADLAQVTGWLQSQGFTVQGVSKSRNTVYFSGKAWQVEAAFHTQLHNYTLNGQTHFANATELSLPAALGTVVTHVGGLSNFRPHPAIQKADPAFTSYISGDHFLTPGDWATIYDVNSIYNAGYTGTGMHVVIAGQTYFDQSDIDSFRSAAGLSATQLNMVCISSSNCTGAPGESANDIPEADLDVEYAGGIAKNATVDFVYASGTDPQGVFGALVYAITNYQVNGQVVPVISMSYADCEPDIGADLANAEEYFFEQAQAQGQTILNSSGDSGAASCDYDDTVSTQGVAVNWPASSPHVTGVGGTEFSGDGNDTGADAYWSYSSTADIISSALQYIPETGWNDTVNDGMLSASGGGVSAIFALPTWQWAPSNYTGSMMRFVPDVAFSASADHDGYLVCSGGNCTNGFRYTNGTLTPYGGTSASTPSFAGLVTLLVQEYGSLGNLNPTLYGMAQNAATYASVFHDVTTGNNVVPCTSGTGCTDGQLGYDATTGYDLVTGLGSVDGGALAAALAPTTPPTTTVVSATPNSVEIGGTTSILASVTSTTPGTITGTVTFTLTEGSSITNLGAVALSGGSAPLSVSATVAAGFVAGSATITATYSGGTSYASSSGTAPLAVTQAQTTTAVSATPNSVVLNGTTTLSATVSPAGGTGTVTFKTGGTTLGSMPVTGGTATLSNVAVTAANGFSVGSPTITADYSGDANYAASNGTAGMTVTAVTPAATVTLVSATPNSVTMGGSTTLTASVSSGTPGTIAGSVTFAVGGTTVGTMPVTGGTATLSNVAVTAANGFSVGSPTITAAYGGSASYDPSSGSDTGVVVEAATVPTYTFSASSTSIAGSSQVTLTLVSSNYAGTVTLTPSITSTNGNCADVSASLSSNQVTLANGQTVNPVLTITANSSASNRVPVLPWQGGGAILLGSVLGIPFLRKRKRVLAGLLMAGTLALAGFLVACGGSSASSAPKAAAQTYTVTVVPSGSGTVTNPSPVSVTLTVQ